jgi:hypothetical protein
VVLRHPDGFTVGHHGPRILCKSVMSRLYLHNEAMVNNSETLLVSSSLKELAVITKAFPLVFR